MANIPYIYRIYGVFFNKCDKLVELAKSYRVAAPLFCTLLAAVWHYS